MQMLVKETRSDDDGGKRWGRIDIEILSISINFK